MGRNAVTCLGTVLFLPRVFPCHGTLVHPLRGPWHNSSDFGPKVIRRASKGMDFLVRVSCVCVEGSIQVQASSWDSAEQMAGPSKGALPTALCWQNPFKRRLSDDGMQVGGQSHEIWGKFWAVYWGHAVHTCLPPASAVTSSTSYLLMGLISFYLNFIRKMIRKLARPHPSCNTNSLNKLCVNASPRYSCPPFHNLWTYVLTPGPSALGVQFVHSHWSPR